VRAARGDRSRSRGCRFLPRRSRWKSSRSLRAMNRSQAPHRGCQVQIRTRALLLEPDSWRRYPPTHVDPTNPRILRSSLPPSRARAIGRLPPPAAVPGLAGCAKGNHGSSYLAESAPAFVALTLLLGGSVLSSASAQAPSAPPPQPTEPQPPAAPQQPGKSEQPAGSQQDSKAEAELARKAVRARMARCKDHPEVCRQQTPK